MGTVVSVIMPAYNAERTIEASIESVLHQTMRDFELIVLDDGSKDKTVSIVKALMAKDKRISVYINSENIGVAKTRNKGFELAKGAYVALLDSDDLWEKEKLEKQLNLAEKTNADIVYCSYSMIDERNQKICDDFIVPESTSFEDTLVKSVISCSSALLKHEVIKEYRFNDSFYHEDYVFWLELLQNGKKAVGVVDVLASYRIVEGSRASNKLSAAVNRWKIYRNYLHYSIWKSTCITFQYALLGVLKYRRR